ncbi:Protein N-acetyltransferase, RimJ/RimL family [Amycolatopsis arida]|uniref:Protein N-acetyltransferase, RimJ/RimL family n=1 Tax=Amycolatopsis arida TaxID=587909 RepID=A0A1I6AFQ8_9PSEU|nr:RimJ/RimL family protein N-acetyltransferase [Amycolatopsis arida]SFQ67529.1 Protein N-acetyltransferase, RimJ/RimL family [Amycolatopsis arida]
MVVEHLIVAGDLLLRPWVSGDRDAVLGAFADPEMGRQSSEPVDTAAAAAAWIAARQRHWAVDRAYSWAVTDTEGAVLGSVEVSAVDRRHDTGWVSYWTVAPARGRGVASTACRVVSDWALRDLGLFRLELGHRLNNPASCRVATHAGFRPEGIQRDKLRYGDRRYDVEIHARLATDPDPGPTVTNAARRSR